MLVVGILGGHHFALSLVFGLTVLFPAAGFDGDDGGVRNVTVTVVEAED